jgi:plasmid stabilization system protein ParE
MVTWTRRAQANLKSIHKKIAKDSPMNATKVVTEMKESVLRLNDLPYLGVVVPEVGIKQLRQFPSYSWRIIYHLRTEQDVFIVAVVHKHQVFDVAGFKG